VESDYAKRVQDEIQVGKELACGPGSEMVPGRAAKPMAVRYQPPSQMPPAGRALALPVAGNPADRGQIGGSDGAACCSRAPCRQVLHPGVTGAPD
jgi:hypothetical protein